MAGLAGSGFTLEVAGRLSPLDGRLANALGLGVVGFCAITIGFWTGVSTSLASYRIAKKKIIVNATAGNPYRTQSDSAAGIAVARLEGSRDTNCPMLLLCLIDALLKLGRRRSTTTDCFSRNPSHLTLHCDGSSYSQRRSIL